MATRASHPRWRAIWVVKLHFRELDMSTMGCMSLCATDLSIVTWLASLKASTLPVHAMQKYGYRLLERSQAVYPTCASQSLEFLFQNLRRQLCIDGCRDDPEPSEQRVVVFVSVYSSQYSANCLLWQHTTTTGSAPLDYLHLSSAHYIIWLAACLFGWINSVEMHLQPS